MVEFFQNLFSWFVINKDKILLFFTSTNAVTFISTIVLIVKQIKETKLSNSTVKNLAETLATSNKLAKEVSIVSNIVNTNAKDCEELKRSVYDLDKKIDDKFSILSQKLDAILEVQSIVYSSVKDEVARKNIANILTSAKLIETSTRADLERELEELKATVANKAKDMTDTVEEVTAKVKKTVSVKKSNVTRY